MGKKAAWLLWAATKLLVFGASATLTLIFFQQITPPGFPWFPYFALGLFEIGFLAWLLYHMHMAEGEFQAWISLAMIVFSLIAVAVSSTFEVVRFMQPIFGGTSEWMNKGMIMIPLIFPANLLCVGLLSLLSDKHIARWKAGFPSNKNWTLKEGSTTEHKQLDGPTEEMEVTTMSNLATPVKKKSSRTQADRSRV